MTYFTLFIVFIILLILIFLINKFLHTNAESFQNNENQLIKQFLLNDDLQNKPKLWIHVPYQHNSRKWTNFNDRTSTDLNEPFIELTMDTIIRHNKDDFNIYLIDDSSFETLIPEWTLWDYNLDNATDIQKKNIRNKAFLQIIYLYSGIIVPSSFVCFKSLLSLYAGGGAAGADETPIKKDIVIIAEKYNNDPTNNKSSVFIPDISFVGCSSKKNNIIKDLLNISSFVDGFYNEIKDYYADYLEDSIDKGYIELIPSYLIGLSTADEHKPILIEDLFEENIKIDISENAYGVYFPNSEMLKRTRYQWFAYLSKEEILSGNNFISKSVLEK